YTAMGHERLGVETILSLRNLLFGGGIITLTWVVVILLTTSDTAVVFLDFYRKVRPAASGWNSLLKRYPNEVAEPGRLPMEIGLMLVGSVMVYSAVFATGFWIYGNVMAAVITTIIAIVGGIIISKSWSRMK